MLRAAWARRDVRLKRKESLMKYVIGLVLGIPIPILAIYFLVSHC